MRAEVGAGAGAGAGTSAVPEGNAAAGAPHTPGGGGWLGAEEGAGRGPPLAAGEGEVSVHAREGAVRCGGVALAALGADGVEAGLEERPVEHLKPALRTVPPQRAALPRERGDYVLEPLRHHRSAIRGGGAAAEGGMGGRVRGTRRDDVRGGLRGERSGFLAVGEVGIDGFVKGQSAGVGAGGMRGGLRSER